MIIPLPHRLNKKQYKELVAVVNEFNIKIQPIVGAERTIYAMIGDESDPRLIKRVEGLPYIDRIDRVQVPFKLMSKKSNLAKNQIKVGRKVLGQSLAIIAGPCAVDHKNKNLMLETAHALKEIGVDMLRGGVWKPRTSPYSFQGDEKSLEILLEARSQTGLPINTEIMDEEQARICVDAGVDSFQVGARNALNYRLLQQLGEMTANKNMNVLLKRSMHMGPVNEFILAAEYIAANGNPNIILCPRGTMPAIQGFRNSPDESITVLLKERTWAPVIVDPSHSVGKSVYVPNACLAAIGYGADGIVVECNLNPGKGLGDDPKQAITPDTLAPLIKDCRAMYQRSKKYLPQGS
ncbi:MAG: 3-deoxy-D-arabino-heptulosonate 7-phosphate synthase [Fibrobacteria bacterium]|nr:3-deoxy-D-arabino-heptulosonate 7-phosphate synthase [Fibrobacteria bacterium]